MGHVLIFKEEVRIAAHADRGDIRLVGYPGCDQKLIGIGHRLLRRGEGQTDGRVQDRMKRQKQLDLVRAILKITDGANQTMIGRVSRAGEVTQESVAQLEIIVTMAALQPRNPITMQRIVAGIAIEVRTVGSAIRIEEIRVLAAVDRVMPRTGMKFVAALVSLDIIVAVPAQDRVVTGTAIEAIRAIAAIGRGIRRRG